MLDVPLDLEGCWRCRHIDGDVDVMCAGYKYLPSGAMGHDSGLTFRIRWDHSTKHTW